jgi:hypothetical protein
MIGRYRREDGMIMSPLPRRVRIEHNDLGSIHARNAGDVEALADLLEFAPVDDPLVRLVQEGRYLDPATGAPKADHAAAHMRALLLGSDTHLDPDGTEPVDLEPHWLIEGNWERDSLLQLSGPPKAGKSEVGVVDVIRTLVTPGYEFLGRYPRGNISEADLWRGVVLIDTEGQSRPIEKLLAPLSAIGSGVYEDGAELSARRLVKVYHLRELGVGPLGFNLFDPTTFEQWRRVLTRCDACEGDDNWGPLALICDNGTAVLRALGMNVQEHISEFQERFRALGESIGTPSMLFVTHSDKGGGNALGGSISNAGSDGELRYFTKEPNPGPNAARYFARSPRTGDVEGLNPTQVNLVGGRPILRLRANGAAETGAASPTHGDADAAEADVLALFHAAPGGLSGSESTGGGGADGRRLRAARDRLRARGVLTVEREGRQGQRWRLAVSDDTHDADDTDDTVVIDLTAGSE